MEDNPIFSDDYELLATISQARHAVSRVRERELRRYGISTRKGEVLCLVQALGPKATPAEMARWLFRQSHGVSALLNRMEGEGLVKRVKDLERKNQVRVVMTRKGQKAYLELVVKDPIHRVMSSLSEGERQRMRSNLLKIRDNALEELRVDTKPLYPPPLSV